MRRSLGKYPNPTIGIAARHTLIGSSSFSTTAGGGGGGRGRGRGRSPSNPPYFQFTAPTPPGMTEPGDDDDEDHPKASPFPSGMGHGRGKALPSTPILPSFSSFKEAISSTGRGRAPAPPQQTEPQHFGPKRPIFFSKEEVTDSTAPKSQTGYPNEDSQDSKLPSSIISVLSGAGRGKPPKQLLPDEKSAKEENRHLRSRQSVKGRGVGAVSAESSAVPRLSREDAVKKAVGILSTGGSVAEESGRGKGGFRGRGTRGRGWRGRGRGRVREGRVQDAEDDDDAGAGLYLGDDADGEKLAEKLGPETMGKLVDAFEEMSDRVLPCPMADAYLDALHTNFMIECEPEYLMEEFGTNPDIDEKRPIPLQDALEKMKPFLMAYEGIRSQEEWEEVVKETMEQVPIMKELVDYYSGPDRVTAKKQQEELERVAKTLPESAPASVKRFTERAVLSLQSNPGWGFDKKCQFMDKLVWEVSQHYK